MLLFFTTNSHFSCLNINGLCSFLHCRCSSLSYTMPYPQFSFLFNFIFCWIICVLLWASLKKKSNTWLYLIQLHRITPQVHQMLKQPSYASMNYFVQTYKHYKVGVQATFQVENTDLLFVITQLIVNNSDGNNTQYTTLKCLSLLLVFHGKIVSLFFLWFNEFSLSPFNWSHLESLEMMSEALSFSHT